MAGLPASLRDWICLVNIGLNKKGAACATPQLREENVNGGSAVHGFSVEVDVETLDFHLAGDSEADHQVDHLEDDRRDDGAVQEGADHVVELDQHLAAIAVDQPALAGRVDRV